jgi:hypothetical protein
MSHVDENNYLIVQYDILIQEYIKSNRTSDTFVNVITPYFSNFQIPTKWPSFMSNFMTVSDVDSFEDLVRLLKSNYIPIKILTLSFEEDKRKNMDNYYIKKKSEFLKKLYDFGCEIFFTPLNHGKITVTSQAVLFGSANITVTGLDADKQWNVGHYFPKNDENYFDKKKYANKKFDDESVVKWEPT